MNIFERVTGKILYYLAKGISFLLKGLINITEIIVELVSNIGKGLLGLFIGLISMGGCLFLLLLGPYGITLLFHPVILPIVLLLIMIPILGTRFVSYLKYLRYMLTEYLFDKSDNLVKGKAMEFPTLGEYGDKYKRVQEEKRRRERRKRQEEQQKMWEERFRQWNRYQQQQRGAGGYWNQGGGYNQGQGFANPAIEFKQKYEESCDVLGVDYNADKSEIRSAYRRKAKKYHPDINRSANATEMFQKVNDAYEFLSDANIERYKSLN